MRWPIGIVSHEPSPPGARKFQRPTRVSATKVIPRFASQTAGPSLDLDRGHEIHSVLAAGFGADYDDLPAVAHARRVGDECHHDLRERLPVGCEVDEADRLPIAARLRIGIPRKDLRNAVTTQRPVVRRNVPSLQGHGQHQHRCGGKHPLKSHAVPFGPARGGFRRSRNGPRREPCRESRADYR